MPQATFRFYAELNDFLPPEKRFTRFSYPFLLPASVKHLIEALGVAHTEVDVILVNGISVDFGYIVQDGDDISVYPVFESLDITPLLRLRPLPLRQTRFVLDTHLGRLAAYLRMLGFDTLYRNDYADSTLAQISDEQERVLLTRDRGLLKRSRVTRGCLVRSSDPRQQVIEVLCRLNLARSVQPFRRCLRCNGMLHAVEKDAVRAELPANTERYYHEFHRCAECGQIYWKGAHYQRMQQLIKSVLEACHAQT